MSNYHDDLEQDAHVEGRLSGTLTALLFQEGFIIDHGGNMILTWHADLRMPQERSPIGPLIKYCEAEFAIERCGTVKLAKPPHFRQEGETLIYDKNEGFAAKETLVQREVPISDTEHARMQSLNDDINKALQSSGAEGVSSNTTLTGQTVTDTDRNSLEWGNDMWIFSTAIEPTSEAETKALLESLDPKYDHRSYIPSPRTFAQMLARAYVEEYGTPKDAQEPFEHTINGIHAGKTYHRQMIVVHGPVLYVEDPYAMCASALTGQDPLVRTLLPIFIKRKSYSRQREYRFVIPDKTPHEADCKIMPVTSMLTAAIGRPGDGRGPMVVPALDTTGAEPALPPKTILPPPLPNPPTPFITDTEIAELRSVTSAIPDRHKVAIDEEPPDDFHEAVGVYPAVATLHEKIDHAFWGIATTEPERKLNVTSAAWYAERSIRRLCGRFGNPITGISVTDDNSVVIDIRLPHWNESECKLAVMPSGTYALTLKRKNQGTRTVHSSAPSGGPHGVAPALDDPDLDAIADFEPQTIETHGWPAEDPGNGD